MQAYYDEYKWFWDQPSADQDGRCIEWHYGYRKQASYLSECLSIETPDSNETKSALMKMIGACVIGLSVLLSVVIICDINKKQRKVLNKYEALRPKVEGGHWSGYYVYCGNQIFIDFPHLQFTSESQI